MKISHFDLEIHKNLTNAKENNNLKARGCCHQKILLKTTHQCEVNIRFANIHLNLHLFISERSVRKIRP